jgi:RNA polymerase sigma-70 factor (ECF subfamily)
MGDTTGPNGADGLLGAARAGDHDAFAALVRPYRVELHALCYRMLGSAEDADDAMQDVLLRAWRGLRSFEGRSALRTWLVRIATNACLSRLARRPARTVPLDGPPSAPGHGPGDRDHEAPWLTPYPDRLLVDDEAQRPDLVVERTESLELAFVAALHRLSPQARAVLVLRAVMGLSARETADALGTSVPAVNSTLQRARAAVRRQVPVPEDATPAPTDDRVRDLVGRYCRAMAEGDVPGVLALLHNDVTWAMPPMRGWYRGTDAVGWFLRSVALRDRWRHLPTGANGQPAVACYRWDGRAGAYVATALDVLTVSGDRIAAVTGFVDPRAVAACGLPDRLPRPDVAADPTEVTP